VVEEHLVLAVEHQAVVVAEQLETHMVETRVRVIKDFQEELEHQEMVVAEAEEM
jgi:hypothetical protein